VFLPTLVVVVILAGFGPRPSETMAARGRLNFQDNCRRDTDTRVVKAASVDMDALSPAIFVPVGLGRDHGHNSKAKPQLRFATVEKSAMSRGFPGGRRRRTDGV
jgi:hypothetical protein